MADASEFDRFWACYPRRVAKLSAMKAFTKARRIATLAEILEGVARYRDIKPDYADFAHPASWLNAGRWMDEADEEPVQKSKGGLLLECPHDPPCATRWDCGMRQSATRKRA